MSPWGARSKPSASRSSCAARRGIVYAARAFSLRYRRVFRGSRTDWDAKWGMAMLKKDSVSGAVLIAVGGWIAWEAKSFPKLAGLAEGPGLFPTISGLGLVVCGTLIMVSGVFRRVAVTAPSEPPARLSVRAWINSGAIVLGVILFAILLDPVGFHLVALGLMFSELLLLGARWWKALLLAVGVVALVHVIFVSFLHVPLPWGLLEPIAW